MRLRSDPLPRWHASRCPARIPRCTVAEMRCYTEQRRSKPRTPVNCTVPARVRKEAPVADARLRGIRLEAPCIFSAVGSGRLHAIQLTIPIHASANGNIQWSGFGRGRRVGRAAPVDFMRNALLVAALGAGLVAGEAPFDVADFIKAGDGASAPGAQLRARSFTHTGRARAQRLLVRRGSHHPRVCAQLRASSGCIRRARSRCPSCSTC